MTRAERDKLRGLATKASPGPWTASGKSVSRLIGTSNKGVAEAYGWAWVDYCEYWQTAEAAERDASYIAACSPDRILALLDYVGELETALRESLFGDDEDWPKWVHDDVAECRYCGEQSRERVDELAWINRDERSIECLVTRARAVLAKGGAG